jgi:hypothetical protein
MKTISDGNRCRIFIQASNAPEEEKAALYQLIVSYVVRRMICDLTAKNYNNVFLRLGGQLRTEGVSLATGANAFAALEGDTVRFPKNAEFRDAISSRRQYGNIQQNRLRHILCHLERKARDKFDETTSLPDDLTTDAAPTMTPTVVTKAACTSETPEPTRTPSGQPSPGRMGFLKGIRTQPPSGTVVGQFLVFFFRT